MNIKLLTMIAATMCGTCFVSCDDDYMDVSNLPTDIQNEFMTMYPNAKVEEWEQKFGYSVVDFRLNGFDAEAWFGANGWVMTETDIPYQSLPEAVKKVFESSQYASWRVEDVDKVERISTETVYVIEVESGERDIDLYYTSSGILIKDQTDPGATDNNPYLPEQTPTDIESMVKEMYPNAIIIETDRDNGNIEVDIIDQNIGKEVVFNSANEWIYTSWDIHPNLLPDVIKATLTASYADYRIDDADFYETPTGNYYMVEVEKGNREQYVRIAENGEILQ